MTRAREATRGIRLWLSARESFLSSWPMPRAARITVICIVAVALLVTAVQMIQADGWQPANIIDIAAMVAVAVFATSPPLAAMTLALGGVVALPLNAGNTYSVALACSLGLVIYTCSIALSVCYAVAASAWALATQVTAESFGGDALLTTLLVAVMSGAIGVAFRIYRQRQNLLEEANSRLAEEAAAAVQAERDRITDELHNIIAHDITIVVMQARALQLTADDESRTHSTKAITESATQALTDIRRMLRIVHADIPGTSSEPAKELDAPAPERDGLLDTLRLLAERLEGIGTHVEISSLREVAEISKTVATTLVHIAREAVTNVLKHAAGCSLVRITLDSEQETVRLSIWNSPDGARDPSIVSGRYGLRRMSDRVALLGGRFESGQIDRGWQVSATLPRL